VSLLRKVASTAADTLTHPSTPVNIRGVRQEIALLEECCTPLGPAQLSGEEADRMASALRVLADPVRLQIVSLLAGTEEACVCELTPALAVSQPTVSHHLRVLSEAGLLEREQRGRWAYYRLRPEPLRLVADALAPRAMTRTPS
jgi:ArsR family transcriptional regulator, arsenate/arsenite/antimonite-responsive transcriptional repressor